MTDDPARAAARELEPHIAAALGQHEIGMVSRWVALVETIDADGIRGVWALTPEGSTPWDTLGLLNYGIMFEQNAIGKMLADHDDD